MMMDTDWDIPFFFGFGVVLLSFGGIFHAKSITD